MEIPADSAGAGLLAVRWFTSLRKAQGDNNMKTIHTFVLQAGSRQTRPGRVLVTLMVLLVCLVGLTLPMAVAAAPTPVVSIIGGGQYTSLQEAVNAANVGDILELSGGDMVISQAVTIPSNKRLTLDLGGNTLISRIDSAASRMLSVTGNTLNTGAFSLKNGKLLAEDVDGNGLTGGAINSGNAALTVSGIEASGFKASGNGGVINVYLSANGAQNPILIENSTFTGNQSGEQGGGCFNLCFP